MAKKKSSDEIELKVPNIGKAIEKIFKNGWAVLSLILAILLITVLYNGGSVNTNTDSNKVSIDEAAKRVVDFAASQNAVAEVSSSREYAGLYEITLSIEDPELGTQEVPVYTTADGEFLIPSLVPITTAG